MGMPSAPLAPATKMFMTVFLFGVPPRAISYEFAREALPFPLPQKHSWRSTLRFHIEDEQFRGLRLTGIAAHAVYIRGRFVKDVAGVNCLEATTLYLSNDASF